MDRCLALLRSLFILIDTVPAVLIVVTGADRTGALCFPLTA